jgi:hypothetical protein
MAPTVDRVRTDVQCPGRDCSSRLARITLQTEGSGRVFYDWVCPTKSTHVTQQWEPPAKYEVF